LHEPLYELTFCDTFTYICEEERFHDVETV
jgi:hypothetical protein